MRKKTIYSLGLFLSIFGATEIHASLPDEDPFQIRGKHTLSHTSDEQRQPKRICILSDDSDEETESEEELESMNESSLNETSNVAQFLVQLSDNTQLPNVSMSKGKERVCIDEEPQLEEGNSQLQSPTVSRSQSSQEDVLEEDLMPLLYNDYQIADLSYKSPEVIRDNEHLLRYFLKLNSEGRVVLPRDAHRKILPRFDDQYFQKNMFKKLDELTCRILSNYVELQLPLPPSLYQLLDGDKNLQLTNWQNYLLGKIYDHGACFGCDWTIDQIIDGKPHFPKNPYKRFPTVEKNNDRSNFYYKNSGEIGAYNYFLTILKSGSTAEEKRENRKAAIHYLLKGEGREAARYFQLGLKCSDIDKRVIYLNKAAKLGYVPAIFNLALFEYKDPLNRLRRTHKEFADQTQEAYLHEAAKRGSMAAMKRLSQKAHIDPLDRMTYLRRLAHYGFDDANAAARELFHRYAFGHETSMNVPEGINVLEQRATHFFNGAKILKGYFTAQGVNLNFRTNVGLKSKHIRYSDDKDFDQHRLASSLYWDLQASQFKDYRSQLFLDSSVSIHDALISDSVKNPLDGFEFPEVLIEGTAHYKNLFQKNLSNSPGVSDVMRNTLSVLNDMLEVAAYLDYPDFMVDCISFSEPGNFVGLDDRNMLIRPYTIDGRTCYCFGHDTNMIGKKAERLLHDQTEMQLKLLPLILRSCFSSQEAFDTFMSGSTSVDNANLSLKGKEKETQESIIGFKDVLEMFVVTKQKITDGIKDTAYRNHQAAQKYKYLNRLQSAK